MVTEKFIPKAVKVVHYKAISDELIAQWPKEGVGTIIAIGPNGCGKTSLMRAIFDVVQKNFPKAAIHKDHETASITIELEGEQTGQVVIQCFIKKDKDGQDNEQIVIQKPGKTLKGKEANEFLSMLSGAVGSFNIDAFLASGPKKQRETLLAISGIDFSSLDEKEKRAAKNLTEANAAYKIASAYNLPFNNDIANKDFEDVTTLVNQLTELKSCASRLEQVKAQCNQRLDAHDERIRIQTELTNQATDTVTALTKALEEAIIKQNQAMQELERLKQQALILYDECKEMVEQARIQAADAKPELIAELEERIKNAEATNEAIRAERKKKEDFKKYILAQQAKQKAEAELKAVREEKDKAIAEAGLPDGLALTNEGLTLNGLPFESDQIAASQKTIIALKIASKLMGGLRLLTFDGASLDKKNMEEVARWAKSQGISLATEWPDRGEYEQIILKQI